MFGTYKNKKATDNKESADAIKFISINEIFPAQTRCSIQNAKDKAEKAAAKKEDMWKHHGTSILPKKKALPVVLSSLGYVLIDGHHDVLASIQLKAKKVPIKIIADLSHLPLEQFWREAEKNGWAYLYTIDGKRSMPPARFSDLTDDPNRYFAAITAQKYTSNGDGSFTSKGAEYPLWIKVGKDIPFIEFQVANALYKKDFIYNFEQMKNSPSPEILEQARQILLEAQIPGLHVLSSRIHYREINLDQIINSSKESQSEILPSMRK